MRPSVCVLFTLLLLGAAVAAADADTDASAGSDEGDLPPHHAGHTTDRRPQQGDKPTVPFAQPLEEGPIRCAVCRAAIARSIHKGFELGAECDDNKDNADQRCNGTTPLLTSFEAVVNQTCDRLPQEYQATEVYDHDGTIGIELAPADTVEQPESVKKTIRQVCVKWTEDFTGLKDIAFSAYATEITDLDLDTAVNTCMYRYCHLPCAAGYVHPKDQPKSSDDL